MAAVAVTNDSNRIHDMGDTDGVTGITAIQGAAPGTESDFVYQGSNSVSKKMTTTLNGILVDTSAFGTPRSVDITASDRRLWMLKGIITNKDALLGIGAPAAFLRLGSDSSNFYEVDLAGLDKIFYPLKGGFLLRAVNFNLASMQSNATGSPTLTAVDFFCLGADFSATSRAENVALDAIDIGIGLCLVGGDGANADGTIEDFLTDDQGTTTAGRFGFFSELDDIITMFGRHWIGRNDTGTTTATVYTDQDRVIVCPDAFVGDGDVGFDFDLGNASNVITITNYTIFGIGNGNRARFDTETDVVGGTTDEIQATAVINAFKAGDAVIARSQSGTETPGITNGTRYWVGKDLTATPTGITLHTTRRDAMQQSSGTGGTPVNLTASTAGNGEIWRLDKDDDTRPVIEVTGTSGSSDLINCTFKSFASIVLTAVADITGGKYEGLGSLTHVNGALIDGAEFLDHTTIEGEALITSDDITDITNNEFDNTGGRGHAIKITDGTSPITFNGNVFTGYGGSTTVTDHQFDNTSGVASNQITMDSGDVFVTGEAVYYSKELVANTVVTGLTDNTLYYVRRISAGVYTLHLNEGDANNNNAVISLTAGTGNETHALYSANAAIWNDSGKALTINVGSPGTTPTVRNSINTTASSTTVNNTVTLTVTVKDKAGATVEGASVRIETTAEALIDQGTTNASGVFTSSYDYSGDVGVNVKVRKLGYQPFSTTDTIDANGLNNTATVSGDSIADVV